MFFFWEPQCFWLRMTRILVDEAGSSKEILSKRRGGAIARVSLYLSHFFFLLLKRNFSDTFFFAFFSL